MFFLLFDQTPIVDSRDKVINTFQPSKHQLTKVIFYFLWKFEDDVNNNDKKSI